MRAVSLAISVLALLASLAPVASADPIELYESRFRIDNTLSPLLPDITFCCNLGSAPALPAGWNVAGFDFTTGLGTITATVTGAGSHTVVVGLNHDFLPTTDPDFANESGAAVGTAGTTLWEIDEPGYLYGNLFANVAGTLDNANDVPGGGPEDISWALGRSFNLAAGQTGTVMFQVATTTPGSAFYLHQWEPGIDLYFSVSDATITGGQTVIPEPGTWALFGTVLAFVLVSSRKFRPASR